MIYQVISPFVTDIYGDSFKDAIKQFVKFKHDYDITEMIIKDHQRHYKAQIKYYQKNGINKANINMFPYSPYVYPQIITNPILPVVINIPTYT